jgi:hypothetical protein
MAFSSVDTGAGREAAVSSALMITASSDGGYKDAHRFGCIR